MPQSDQSEAIQSGIFNIPSILSYPKVLYLEDIEEEISGQFVYVIKGYKEEGLAIVIKRDEKNVYLKIGDFDGNDIDLVNGSHPFSQAALFFAEQESSNFVEMMRVLGIQQVLLYISIDNIEESDEDYHIDWKLVDLRVSLNKFYGPGMIRDLFSKVFPTQEVLKITNVTGEALEAIYNNKGSYEGDLILKCSKFKTVERGKEILPLYAKVRDRKRRKK
jgi:hypothetical protein